MTIDSRNPTGPDPIARLCEEYGISQVTCLRDEVLVIGLKQSFANLATPAGEGGPMDHPTKGLILLGGPDCKKPDVNLEPGMVAFFPKFAAAEVEVNNRRLFILKGSEVKARQLVPQEMIEVLAKNAY